MTSSTRSIDPFDLVSEGGEEKSYGNERSTVDASFSDVWEEGVGGTETRVLTLNLARSCRIDVRFVV